MRGRVQDFDAIAAHAFRPEIERLVGELKRAARAALGARLDDGDADADRDDRPSRESRCSSPIATTALRICARELLGRDTVDVVQQHGELLAAVAREHIARARDEHLQHLGDAAQRAVAGLVAVAVVVGFEVIDVDQQDREARAPRRSRAARSLRDARRTRAGS